LIFRLDFTSIPHGNDRVSGFECDACEAIFGAERNLNSIDLFVDGLMYFWGLNSEETEIKSSSSSNSQYQQSPINSGVRVSKPYKIPHGMDGLGSGAGADLSSHARDGAELQQFAIL
jgi:hypothetical protein